MKGSRRVAQSSQSLSAFVGFRFPPEVILLAVRRYLRFGLSYRDLEDLFAERGIEVDHVTLHRWVQRFAPLLINAARPCRHAVGTRWFVDETYVKVAGVWRYVYRAVDGYDQVVDARVHVRRRPRRRTTHRQPTHRHLPRDLGCDNERSAQEGANVPKGNRVLVTFEAARQRRVTIPNRVGQRRGICWGHRSKAG